MQTTWYDSLRAIRSLGSQKTKIAHMGELAEQRKQHMGQFFTPDNAAAFMWRFVADLPVRSLLDNSIGSGRLLQFADPAKHALYGVDVHAETIDEVKSVVASAGFDCEIVCAGMEEIHPRNMDCALINPPFSIQLQSPTLSPFHGFTRLGKFGPNTTAVSDEYALMQALDAARIVIALLPRSSADAIRSRSGPWVSSSVSSRLRAVFDLPNDTFKAEGANVATSVLVFGEMRGYTKFDHIVLDGLDDPLPDLKLKEALKYQHGKPSLGLQTLDTSAPTITLPVTGDPEVHVALDGRKVRLRYGCGFTQARVENAILEMRIYSTDEVRLPRGVKYAGQGKLDLEVYLLQNDPIAAFGEFVSIIVDNGGKPVIHAGVRETLANKVRRYARASTPLRHKIWSRGASSASSVGGVAIKTHNVDPTKWLSPVIKGGDLVTFARKADGRFAYEVKGKTYEITADELENKFALQDVSGGWQTVHTGLQEQFPQHAGLLLHRAREMGIDQWLGWDFQLQDCVEALMKPTGAVMGWQQACGKSRLAAALIMLSGVKHGLIVLESRLVVEMLVQLRKLNIDMDEVNVIDAPEKLDSLKRINIVAYERLRLPVDGRFSKRITYARRLRRRIGLIVADEGERLANMDSEQSRALFQVSAKRKYILTGTPVANYPRDIHGLLAFVGGDGTAAQPYGFHRGFLEERLFRSMQYAPRGLDAVRDDFVVMEWATQEFKETLRDGAKREVPKIANVGKFRAWLAPHVKRRLTDEPDVAKYIKLPELSFETVDVDWDEEHLAYYLKAADDFADWYRQSGQERRNNLALLLARLQAVHTALNMPQNGIEGMPAYVGLTSKQRAVLAKLVEIAEAGEKSILFAENPATIKLFHRELKRLGIDSVPFHGSISIDKRVKDKDDNFINGDASHLLATKKSARAGYNLPCASYVLFYDRSWSFREENQAVRRPLRVERKDPVKAIYFHIPGSLDIYQDQMVRFKQDAATAGLDWATPELDDAEFLHLSTILNRFVDDLARLRGVSSHVMRELLKTAA